MAETPTGKVGVQLRVARAQSKARDQLRELLRDTSLVHTLVIARNSADEWTMLCGGMTTRDLGQALVVGTQSLDILIKHEEKSQGGSGPVRLDWSAPTGEPGVPVGRKRRPELQLDTEGNLIPPEGETWIACAECGCNRWYSTIRSNGTAGRLACIRCGNEVMHVGVYHAEGRA